MPDHVYARVSGFGHTLVPVAPFGWQQIPGRTSSVLAVHQAASGPKQATVVIEGGKATVKLGTGTSAASEVLDVLPGPTHDHFLIETSVFTCRWPTNFALTSAPPDAPSKFDLCGADGALVYVQGPFPREKVPALKDMASPGQTIREQGSSWVELGYENQGVAWRQWHHVVSLAEGIMCIVTAQAPEGAAPLTAEAAKQVSESLKPYRAS